MPGTSATASLSGVDKRRHRCYLAYLLRLRATALARRSQKSQARAPGVSAPPAIAAVRRACSLGAPARSLRLGGDIDLATGVGTHYHTLDTGARRELDAEGCAINLLYPGLGAVGFPSPVAARQPDGGLRQAPAVNWMGATPPGTE